MTNTHARQGQDRKHEGKNFTRQGKHGRGNGGGRNSGEHRNKYGKFSTAANRQAELEMHGGSLLGTMPLVKEAREREEDLRKPYYMRRRR